MRLIFFIFFLFSMLCLPSGFKRLTCGFKLPKVVFKHSYRSDWDVPSDLSKEEIVSLLSQPFFYLDRGAQCYVFSSLDDHYVLKIFRYDRGSFFEKMDLAKKQMKLEKLFNACILAFTKAKQETGVLFLHLNETEGELPTLFVKGPLHQSMHLKLDHYRFVIQKKMKPFRESLLDAYRKGDSESMRRQIDSFARLIDSRSCKGISNSDPSVSRNFGFLEDQAFEIDFGNYSENLVSQDQERLRFMKKFRDWLSQNAPEWVSYLDARA